MTIHQMSASLRKNDQIIRACILYEALDMIPLSKAYENFCRKVGKDAIPQEEFDYWYYHFSNVNDNLEHDKSLDSKSTMYALPLNMFHYIIDRVDYIDTLALAKVCTGFRVVVKKQKNDLAKLWIIHNYSLDTSDETNNSIIEYDGYKITYQPVNGGCKVSFVDQHDTEPMLEPSNKFIKGGDSVQLCHNDLKLVFENRRVVLENLTIYLNIKEKCLYKKCFTDISTMLKDTRSIEVKVFDAHFVSISDYAALLELFSAGKLESLNINPYTFNRKELETPEDCEHLASMEQWKMAEMFYGRYYFVDIPIERFLHFKSFEVELVWFTEKDAGKLRDANRWRLFPKQDAI